MRVILSRRKPKLNPGQQVGNYLVTGNMFREGGESFYPCRCTCGRTTKVRKDHLESGKTKSCANCAAQLKRRQLLALYGLLPPPRHGANLTNDLAADENQPLMLRQFANAYNGMCRRTRSSSNSRSATYENRGIGMWPGWRGDKGFFRFATDMAMELGEKPGPQWTLDRIDNNLGYVPGNMRWATWKQQGRNRSNNLLVEYQGRQMALSEAVELSGIPRDKLLSRLKHGWPAERLFDPVTQRITSSQRLK